MNFLSGHSVRKKIIPFAAENRRIQQLVKMTICLDLGGLDKALTPPRTASYNLNFTVTPEGFQPLSISIHHETHPDHL